MNSQSEPDTPDNAAAQAAVETIAAPEHTPLQPADSFAAKTRLAAVIRCRRVIRNINEQR
jgi:hypothetical protein